MNLRYLHSQTRAHRYSLELTMKAHMCLLSRDFNLNLINMRERVLYSLKSVLKFNTTIILAVSRKTGVQKT
jgi:hypothetical protein